MTEILTESFCERCGTRYTFESTAPRQKRMGGIRILGRGLKNFVLSDDSSLDEAMAAARSDVEREATAQQLDAFHRTFNFCMSCRQYTCGNCWNGVDARCLSCAPLPEAEIVAHEHIAPPTEVDLERLLRLTATPAETAWHSEAAPAPEVLPEPEVAAEPEPEPELVGKAEVVARADAELVAPVESPAMLEVDGGAADSLPDWATARPPAEEPVAEMPVAAALAPDAAPAIEAPAAAGEAETVVPVAAEPALQGLGPGESLDDAIAAYEASQTEAAEPEAAEPEAAAAEAVLVEGIAGGPGIDVVEQPTWPFAPIAVEPAPELEPVAAEPVAAEPEPEAEPVAAAPQPAPEPEPEAFPIAAAAPVAAQPEPEAPAPEPPAPAIPAAPPVAPFPPVSTPAGPPQWPTGPRWPTGIPARQTMPPPPPGPLADPLAAIMARQATEAMWAASSRDVIQPPLVAQAAPIAGVQPCVSCGISLSANARFCRRCGTAQTG